MGTATKDLIDEFRRFADNKVHPLVSPDNWNVYSQLVDFIDELDESLDQISNEKPVDPVLDYWRPDGGSHYKCGNCGCGIGYAYESRFCKRYGQAVEWHE